MKVTINNRPSDYKTASIEGIDGSSCVIFQTEANNEVAVFISGRGYVSQLDRKEVKKLAKWLEKVGG